MKQDFIQGIDNYCDRWCERCAFTSRCSNFKDANQTATAQVNINNTALWEHVTENFRKTIDLLKQAAKEEGIDLSISMVPQSEDLYEKRRAVLKKAAREHELTRLCNEYQKIVTPFVKKPRELDSKEKELETYQRLGIKANKEIRNILSEMDDSFDTIQWYLFFIGAKLQRALYGKLEGEELTIGNRFQKDGDGSAKVTILAIEKSITAWTKLYKLVPSLEDEALTALSLLSQLKKKTLEEFPDAMLFKRPGFDD